ncbi:MAG TPA: glycosyltransferase [Tepidisphaeraceae bacterium]|jgi:glycosyltransferase involved in cell wall biosynthesis
MKVLHVISSIDARAGGPTAALQGLALAQKKAGLDVRVITTYREGDPMTVADALRAADISIETVGPAHGRFHNTPELASHVRKAVGGAEVLHIHALWEQIQHDAATEAQHARIPYIFRPCGMLDPWSLGQNKLVKKLYLAWRLRADLDRAAMIHFTSNTERDLTAPLRLKSKPIVVPNGIDLNEFAKLPERGRFRAKFPVIGPRRILLFLSRVHFKKGLDLLIPAFAQARLQDAVLVIAGPDAENYTQSLHDLAKQHGVADRIIFTGMLKGVERLEAMVDADLFVLPSRQENFGIAVVEALAAGLPVVISDQVNIHQEITAAGVGAAVPLDIPKLSQTLSTWLNDEAVRRSAADKAREFALTRYDWNRIAQKWSEIYNNLALTAWAS